MTLLYAALARQVSYYPGTLRVRFAIRAVDSKNFKRRRLGFLWRKRHCATEEAFNKIHLGKCHMKTMDGFGQDPVSYNSIQVDNLKIFYRQAGPKDGRIILLLHGVPTSSRMYQPMLESSLSTKYRLIAPDFPGFGHSPRPSRQEFSYTFDNLAQVTQYFADALKLNHYMLFLHDYGGPVGM